MRFLLLTLAISLLYSTSGCSQPTSGDCAQFRVGNFSYKEEAFSTVFIERTATTHKEHEIKSGFKIHYDINWTDDCSYVLIQTWTNHEELSKENGKSIKVEIVKILGNGYKYNSDDAGFITRGTIVKMDE